MLNDSEKNMQNMTKSRITAKYNKTKWFEVAPNIVYFSLIPIKILHLVQSIFNICFYLSICSILFVWWNLYIRLKYNKRKTKTGQPNFYVGNLFHCTLIITIFGWDQCWNESDTLCLSFFPSNYNTWFI